MRDHAERVAELIAANNRMEEEARAARAEAAGWRLLAINQARQILGLKGKIDRLAEFAAATNEWLPADVQEVIDDTKRS